MASREQPISGECDVSCCVFQTQCTQHELTACPFAFALDVRGRQGLWSRESQVAGISIACIISIEFFIQLCFYNGNPLTSICQYVVSASLWHVFFEGLCGEQIKLILWREHIVLVDSAGVAFF